MNYLIGGRTPRHDLNLNLFASFVRVLGSLNCEAMARLGPSGSVLYMHVFVYNLDSCGSDQRLHAFGSNGPIPF